MSKQATRNKVIENYVNNDNTYAYPNRIVATAELAQRIVHALTDVTPYDEMYYVDKDNYAKGFIYAIPEGGYNNYLTILVKRYGVKRTQVTVATKWNTPEERVLEHLTVSSDETLPTFVAKLKQYS